MAKRNCLNIQKQDFLGHRNHINGKIRHKISND